MEGYKPVTYTAKTDTDHYVAETIWKKYNFLAPVLFGGLAPRKKTRGAP